MIGVGVHESVARAARAWSDKSCTCTDLTPRKVLTAVDSGKTRSAMWGRRCRRPYGWCIQDRWKLASSVRATLAGSRRWLQCTWPSCTWAHFHSRSPEEGGQINTIDWCKFAESGMHAELGTKFQRKQTHGTLLWSYPYFLTTQCRINCGKPKC